MSAVHGAPALIPGTDPDIPPRRIYRTAGSDRPRWVVPAVATVALVVFITTMLGATTFGGYTPDTRQYVARAYEMNGEPRDKAVHDAAEAWCLGNVAGRNHNRAIFPYLLQGPPDSVSQCAQDAAAWDLDASPRYTAIFAARVGVAAMYLPFLLMFGGFWGMWVAAALFTALCGVLTALLVRVIGGGWQAAIAGQLLFTALPVGRATARPLSEAPVHLVLMIGLLGAALVLRDRKPGLGLGILALGVLAMIPVKESTATALGTALVLATAVCLAVPAQRRRSTGLLALVGAAAVALAAAWSAWRGDPGLNESLQDTFTVNFTSPDQTGLYGKLLHLNLGMWGMELRQQAMAPLGLLALGLAGWLAWRQAVWVAALLAIPVFIGVATTVMHPLYVEAPRELSPAWIACSVALALLADRVPDVRRGRGRNGAVSGGRRGTAAGGPGAICERADAPRVP